MLPNKSPRYLCHKKRVLVQELAVVFADSMARQSADLYARIGAMTLGMALFFGLPVGAMIF